MFFNCETAIILTLLRCLSLFWLIPNSQGCEFSAEKPFEAPDHPKGCLQNGLSVYVISTHCDVNQREALVAL